jgi:hypothetical protein
VWEVKGQGKTMEGVELTTGKVHSQCNTLRTPLNIDLETNNERQDCKIGTVCGEYLGEWGW